jgi:signal peptidase I
MNLIKQIGFIGNLILEFVQSIVLALSLFVLVYLFLVQPNEVKGSSMFPTFKDKEYLLTDKLSYQMGLPKRGDVIVFKAPPSEPCAVDGCEYIKRIIGLPGDKVMVRENQVYVNGNMIDNSFLPKDYVTEPGTYLKEGIEMTIPDGMYLPMGDNRSHSRDGREFGPIKKDLIIGKAFFRYWPVNVLGLTPQTHL